VRWHSCRPCIPCKAWAAFRYMPPSPPPHLALQHAALGILAFQAYILLTNWTGCTWHTARHACCYCPVACCLMVSCRCQTLLSDLDCDRICNSHVLHHKSCPALLNVCGIPAQGQLAGLLSNGSASQGMGPPSMLPPHHGGPLVHPQDWMAQPHMNGQMNGLMPSPQSGPHPNMPDSRYVILQDTLWRITLACKLLCVSNKTCQGKTHLMLKRTLYAYIY